MFHITQKNGFKVSRSTAELYTQTTGIKVDDKKIIGKISLLEITDKLPINLVTIIRQLL